MSLTTNFESIRATIPEGVTLVAVSKFHPVSAIHEIYRLGHRVFGESKVQELLSKHETLPKDIQWHFIGHLQSNKIKYIAPFVSLIHGVDSFKLLLEINKAGAKINRKINCLLQLHIASEETKFGFSFDELNELLGANELSSLEYVSICGLMGMTSYTESTEQVKHEFRSLSTYFKQLKNTYFAQCPEFKELSIGMSGDYEIAIKEGSTIVRIGSSIFGERNYE